MAVELQLTTVNSEGDDWIDRVPKGVDHGYKLQNQMIEGLMVGNHFLQFDVDQNELFIVPSKLVVDVFGRPYSYRGTKKKLEFPDNDRPAHYLFAIKEEKKSDKTEIFLVNSDDVSPSYDEFSQTYEDTIDGDKCKLLRNMVIRRDDGAIRVVKTPAFLRDIYWSPMTSYLRGELAWESTLSYNVFMAVGTGRNNPLSDKSKWKRMFKRGLIADECVNWDSFTDDLIDDHLFPVGTVRSICVYVDDDDKPTERNLEKHYEEAVKKLPEGVSWRFAGFKKKNGEDPEFNKGAGFTIMKIDDDDNNYVGSGVRVLDDKRDDDHTLFIYDFYRYK